MKAKRRLVGADGRAVCARCIVADRPLTRMRGLLGRHQLRPGEGMLLCPAPSVHTFFMRFPIDVVFVDADLRVRRVASQLKPWRVAACRGARAALELAGGEASRLDISVGEQLRFDDASESTGADSRGIKVVVAAGDRAFVNIASFLLARDGFEVDSTRDQRSLCDMVKRRRPDVVLFDVGDGSPPTESSIAELSTRHPEVGLVVVSEVTATATPGALPKWGTFDRLRGEIERAYANSRAGLPAAQDA
jgi:uncharacterized protein